MSLLRIVASIPAVLVACVLASAGLGGCYDLSTNGPTREDFAQDRGAGNAQVDPQDEPPPANPTALDRSDTVVHALTNDPAPPSAPEANGALLPPEKATALPPTR